MQRRLADWWEGQLKTIDNKQAASEFRSPGPTSESRDSLVHINFEDLAGLNICMAADIVPPPIEPGESIVVLPLDEKAGKLAIKVAPAEKTELDGRILRYRIDFQLASRGDYVAVVERHRERLASP